jgi:hypothetical protein
VSGAVACPTRNPLAGWRGVKPKGGPDPEPTLELLIQAAQMLEEHLERELGELRQEQAD